MPYASLTEETIKSKPLATFDYNTALNKYKKQAKRKYPYNFKSLNSQFRAKFNKLINETKNVHKSEYLTPYERDLEQRRAEGLENLNNGAVGRLIKPEENAAHELVSRKITCFNWMQFIKKSVDQAGFFNKLSVAIDEEISSLKEEWQSLSYTATLSNQQLSHLANNTLPELIAMYNFASVEFNKQRGKLPKDIRQKYGKHLSSISASIQKLKNDIVYGMHYRLKLIDEQSSFDNCVHVFANKLVENKLLNEGCFDTAADSLNYSDPLSSEDYQTFASYIETNGSATFKTRLHTLSCYKNNIMTFQGPNATQNKGMLVPAAFQQYIPHKKARSLFKGHNLRHSFFEKKLGFFLSINRKPINFESLPLYSSSAIDAEFKSLSQIKKIIRQEIEKHAKETEQFSASRFNRFFRKKTIAFMEQYAQLLQTADNVRLKNKIKLIKRTANRLIALSNKQDVGLDFPLKTAKLIKKKIKKAKTKLDTPKYERDKTKLLALDENMALLKAKTDMIPVLTNSLDDDIILAPEVEATKENLEQFTSENRPAFLKQFRTQFSDSADDLSASIKALRGNIHGQKFENIAPHYEVLLYCAQELKIDAAIDALQKMLPKMFLFFLQEVLLSRLDEKLMQQHEEFFLKFGQGAKFLDKDFSQHMQDIKAFQKRSLVSYRLHCQSLATCLNDELFKKRFAKDAKSLDDHIALALSTHAEQNVKNSTPDSVSSYLKALNSIRDRAVGQETTVNTIRAQLTDSELALLDPVKGLIELSVLSRTLQKKLKPDSLVNEDRREKHAHLHDSLSRFLKKKNRPQGEARFGLTNSGKRQLFSKRYLEPEALTVPIYK